MSIQQTATRFVLANDVLRREIDTAQGPVTTVYSLRPDGRAGADVWIPTFWPGFSPPYEAAIDLDGQRWQVGGYDPKAPLGPRQGAFTVARHTLSKAPLGEALELTCLPRPGIDLPVEVALRYEIADALPLLVKTVAVRNTGAHAIIVDNLVSDMLCHVRYQQELRVFTDWYEAYGKAEGKDEYYQGWHLLQFPRPIRVQIEPGQVLTGFRCFEYATPNEADEIAVRHHRIFRAMAPWIAEPLISQELCDASSWDELAAVAPRAARNGIELVHLFMTQVFTNVGDYVPRPDLFPRGADDVKRLVDTFHHHGVKVLPYCSLTIAWQAMAQERRARVCEEHPDWQYLGPDGIRYNCYGWGNMCYQSGWGDYIAGKLNWLTEELGFDGLHIDGPYHGLPCLETGHRHRTPESVGFMNWVWEQAFYRQKADRGLFVTVPQDPAALLFGARAVPGGYTEEDFAAFGGMGLVTACRARLYDARYRLPASCTWSWVGLDRLHGHSIEADDNQPATYDHALGGCFGYGHWGLIHGVELYVGPRTEAIYQRWVAFYKKYRHTLCGEMIHLVRPDGRRPDAVLHVNPEADPPAVLVAFNPGSSPARLHLALPLHAAGFEAGQAVSIAGQRLPLDGRAVAGLTVELAAGEIQAHPVSLG